MLLLYGVFQSITQLVQPNGYCFCFVTGDLVLEMNGEQIYGKPNSLALVQKVLSAHRGKVTLAVLPCKKPPTGARGQSTSHTQPSRATKELYSKVYFVYNLCLL